MHVCRNGMRWQYIRWAVQQNGTVDSGCGTMKTVLFLAGLIALALGGAVPSKHEIKVKAGELTLLS